LPSACIAKESVVNKVAHIGQKWTSPHQRAILGATAIVMQPLLDWNNKRVDEETRKVSVARTCAKIIAGTATGVALRYASIKGIQAMSTPLSKIPQNASKFKKKMMTCLLPSKWDGKDQKALEQYQFAMGTMWSLDAMMFTNFLIDAPLTKFLTNKFIALEKKYDEKGGIKS